MFGSAAVAYFAHLARISRVRVVLLRPGGARDRESRRSNDLHAAHDWLGKNRHMDTVVLYEYMSVGDVLNGLIYLILSSPTRIDAVWHALRPFKEG